MSNRRLTDAGFAEVIDTLLECLQTRDEEYPQSIGNLVELHLKGNDLTTESLPKLGQAVMLSSHYLRDLDLSDNNIQIASAAEKEAWRVFLGSFQHCYMLKRLNLSGNPLGTAGLEILAKIYLGNPVHFTEADPVDIGVDLPSSTGAESSTAPKHSDPSLLRGLRSVPYLILSNLELTKTAAIHLSSMLSIQMARAHLRRFLPVSHPVLLPEEARHACRSIIWLPNPTLRWQMREFLECATTLGLPAPPPFPFSSGIKSADVFNLPSTLCSPKVNLKSSAGRKQLPDRDRYKRFQKNTAIEALQEEGANASELWTTALNMLRLRTIIQDEASHMVSIFNLSRSGESITNRNPRNPNNHTPFKIQTDSFQTRLSFSATFHSLVLNRCRRCK